MILRKVFIRLIVVATVLWLLPAMSFSQTDDDGLATDIKVSLLSVAPGYTIYTAHGHCALRLQCPSAGLDLSFTYGLDDTAANRLAFFTGEALGEYAVAHSRDYLQDYIDEGRQVVEYELNLSLQQKRRLWELLDNELARGAYRRYNYLTTNCASMCASAVNSALQDDTKLVYDSISPILNGTYRHFVHHISKDRPWVDFFWNTLLGAEGDEVGQKGLKYSPSLLVETWQHASVMDTIGSRRPLLLEKNGHVLIAGDDGSGTSWLTPTVCFAIVLLLVVVLTAVEQRGRLRRLAAGVDALLLLTQTVIALALCYTTFCSSLEGTSGNWYVVVFNPLPLLLWLWLRRWKGYRRLVFCYFLLLIVFILLTPFVSQIDTAHSLVVAILAVRCLRNAKGLKAANG
ncbi:lipoprotein N-acyltransferase Lnb domain-containing protein [Xylanibacter brevis]|uniref:lipoprotein N-acyltransferase Lnb domain-containing protein n=1 Tax=Xylanibacter brevis TaxID=83231 RepID=UPI0009E0A33A|nr:DUF4105 domain-containing protein [Xylanibacter brevis]